MDGRSVQPLLVAFYERGHLAQALARVLGAAQVLQKAAGFVVHGLGFTQLHGRKSAGPDPKLRLAVVGIGWAKYVVGSAF